MYLEIELYFKGHCYQYLKGLKNKVLCMGNKFSLYESKK